MITRGPVGAGGALVVGAPVVDTVTETRVVVAARRDAGSGESDAHPAVVAARSAPARTAARVNATQRHRSPPDVDIATPCADRQLEVP
jgi:hypothetical protein